MSARQRAQPWPPRRRATGTGDPNSGRERAITNETWAAIIGALVGSASGGAITALLQWVALLATKKERNRALAYSLLFKLGQIHSHLKVLSRNYSGAFGGVDPKTVENPWSRLKPLANSPSRVTFSTDEMALVFATASTNTFNELMMMDELHNATLDAFDVYAKKWAELTDLAKPVAVGGGVVTIEYGDDLPVQMRIMAINDFAVSIGQHLEADSGKALNVLQQLAGVFTTKLAVNFTPLPKAPAVTTSVTKLVGEDQHTAAGSA